MSEVNEDYPTMVAKFNKMYKYNSKTLKTWSDIDIVQTSGPSLDVDTW